MLQLLNEILNANTYSWSVVVVLAVLAGGFVSSSIGNLLYFMIFCPSFILGGLAGIFAIRRAEIELVRERELSTIAEAAIGMMVTLVVLLVLARTIMALYGLTIRPSRTGARVGHMIVPR
jgi:hypothetical protein